MGSLVLVLLLKIRNYIIPDYLNDIAFLRVYFFRQSKKPLRKYCFIYNFNKIRNVHIFWFKNKSKTCPKWFYCYIFFATGLFHWTLFTFSTQKYSIPLAKKRCTLGLPKIILSPQPKVSYQYPIYSTAPISFCRKTVVGRI